MLKKVLNLELSSGGFSADAPGVEARDAAFEAVAEFVLEPGRAVVHRVCLWESARVYVKLA